MQDRIGHQMRRGNAQQGCWPSQERAQDQAIEEVIPRLRECDSGGGFPDAVLV
jgi:hypothetical protein